MSNKETQQSPKKLARPSLLKVCLIFGLCLIFLTFFQWNLVDYLSSFCIGPLMLLSWLALAILFLVSIAYIPYRIKKAYANYLDRKFPWGALLPFLVTGITILILYFVPFTSIWLNLEFASKKPGYEEIVRMVENGELQAGDTGLGLVRLPRGYRYLSRSGGDIIIDESDGVTSVFFYTYRGVLDSASGYIYRSNDTPPPEYLSAVGCQQVVRQEPYWYFCGAH